MSVSKAKERSARSALLVLGDKIEAFIEAKIAHALIKSRETGPSRHVVEWEQKAEDRKIELNHLFEDIAGGIDDGVDDGYSDDCCDD